MADLPQNDQYNTGDTLGHLGTLSALKGLPLSRPTPTSYPNVQASAQASIPVGQTFDSSPQPASQPLTKDITEGNFKGGGTPGGYNWQMPSSAENVRVRSFPPDINTGQYMTDTADPNNNLKISRGLTPFEKSIILQGKSPQMYQVDHIIPLWAGGADTNANLHVLSNSDHGKKTQIEAVPFTLLTNGLITRDQARLMAMKWKDLDSTDFPHVYTDTDSEGFPGTMSIQDAQSVAARWAQQGKTTKPVTFKDILANVPEGMKNLKDLFGKDSLPNEVAEPLKGFASGVTAGWVPYQPAENAGIASKVLGYGGYLGGSVATMGGIMGLFGKAAGVAPTAMKAVGTGAKATAAKLGYKVAQTAEDIPIIASAPQIGAEVVPEAISGLSPMTDMVAQMGSKVAKPNFYNTIDKKAFAKFTAASITYGQIGPQGIVGAMTGNEDATPVKRLVEDTLYSAVTGYTPPGLDNSLKLFAGILLGNTMANSIAGKETTADDFINAATMAAFHALGSKGTQARIDGLAKSFDEDFSQRVAYDIFHAYDNGTAFPKLREMDPLPLPKTSAEIDQAVVNAQRDLNRRFLGLDQEAIPFKKGPSTTVPGEKIQGKDWTSHKPAEISAYKASADDPRLITGDMDAYNAELNRIQTAALILKRGGLTPGDLLEHDRALIQSFADKLHKEKPEKNRPVTHPSDVTDVAFHVINSPEWHNSYPDGAVGEQGTAPYVGRMALTGHSVNTKGKEQGNLPPVLDYFDMLDKTYARPGTAGKEVTRKVFGINVTEQKAAYDQFGPKGENTIIWFTPVKETKTGAVSYLKLGFTPTNERLNLNPDAINNTKAVKNGYYQPIPAHMNKDEVAQLMRKDGIRVLFGSVSPRAEVSTKKSGNPWMEIDITNESRRASLDYAKKQQMTPAQQGVANTAHGLQTKLLTAGVSRVAKAITKPSNVVFSSFRDVATAANPQSVKNILRAKLGIDVTDKEAVAIFSKIQKDKASFGEEIETTKSILDGFYEVFSSNTPQKLKSKLQGIFNITIDDTKAQDLFLRQDEVSIQEAIGLLGNNAEFLPDFLKSSLLKRGDINRGELPFIKRSVIGGMKTVNGLKGPALEVAPTTQTYDKEGFRPVTENEILPIGYTTKMNFSTGKNITNAPHKTLESNNPVVFETKPYTDEGKEPLSVSKRASMLSAAAKDMASSDPLDIAVSMAKERDPNFGVMIEAPGYYRSEEKGTKAISPQPQRDKDGNLTPESVVNFKPRQEDADFGRFIKETTKQEVPAGKELPPALIRQNINEPTNKEQYLLERQQDAPQEIMAQQVEEEAANAPKPLQETRKAFISNIINETVDVGRQKLDEVEFSKRTGDEGYGTLLRNVISSASPKIKGKQYAPGKSSTGQPLTQEEKRHIDDEVKRQLTTIAEGVYNTKIDSEGTLGFTIGLKKGDDMFEEAKMVIEAENAAKFGNHNALADLKESMGEDTFQAVQGLLHPEWGSSKDGRLLTKEEIDWSLWEKTQKKVADDIINQFVELPKKTMPEGSYMRTVSEYLDEFFPSVFGKDWKDNRLITELLASLNFKEGQGRGKYSFFGGLLNTKSESKTQPVEYLRELSSGTRNRAQEILKKRRAEVAKAKEARLNQSPEAKSGIPGEMQGHIETEAQRGDMNVETPTRLDEVFAGLTVAVHDGTTPTAQNAIHDMMRFSHEFTTAYQNLYEKKLSGRAFNAKKYKKTIPTELSLPKNPETGNLLPEVGGGKKKDVKWEPVPRISFSGNDAGVIADRLIKDLSKKGVVMGESISKAFPEYWDKILKKHEVNLTEQKDFGAKSGKYFKKTLLPQFTSLTKMGIVPKNKNNSPIEKVTKYGKTLFAREKHGSDLSKEESGFLSHYLKWQNLNQGFTEAKRATEIGASDYPRLKAKLKEKPDGQGGLMDNITAPFKPMEYTAPSKPVQAPPAPPLTPAKPLAVSAPTASSATTPQVAPPKKEGLFDRFNQSLQYVAPMVKKAEEAVGPSIDAVKREGEKISSALKGPKSYNIRGLSVNDKDFNEAANVLYSEISNRPGKSEFEINNILNVALNRMIDSGGKETLTDVLHKPAQFQGYAPLGAIGSNGKVRQSNYQQVTSGQIGDFGKQKLKIIKDALEKVKSGEFKDTTAGSRFYVHATDGTMWLGKTIDEAKKNAKNHEKSAGKQLSKFGTMVGYPILASKLKR